MLDQAYDPTVVANTPEIPTGLRVCSTPQEACANADMVVIATEWEEFTKLDPDSLADVMATPIVFDARNLLTIGDWEHCGFEYHGIGR